MKIHTLKEQGQLLEPWEEGGEDRKERTENALNDAMPKLGRDTYVYAEYYPERREVEVAIKMDAIVGVSLMRDIVERVGRIVPVRLKGISPGTVDSILLHLEILGSGDEA